MWRIELQNLVSTGAFRTQGELVRALAERGHEVAQPTVSKALTALGVDKEGGVYRLPPVPSIGARIHRVTSTAGGCMVVVVTDPAHASVVAQYIDSADMSGILGTIAGDDTVFVATTGPAASELLAGRLAARDKGKNT